MEKPISDVLLRNGIVTVGTKPYEIKTVKVSFASASPAEVVREAK
jgi:hypothetical protein